MRWACRLWREAGAWLSVACPLLCNGGHLLSQVFVDGGMEVTKQDECWLVRVALFWTVLGIGKLKHSVEHRGYKVKYEIPAQTCLQKCPSVTCVLRKTPQPQLPLSLWVASCATLWASAEGRSPPCCLIRSW